MSTLLHTAFCLFYGSVDGLILTTLTLLLAYGAVQQRSSRKTKAGCKRVPKVPLWLPFIGHLFQLGLDPNGFLRRCYRKYGKIFTIRLGGRKVALMCDREHLNEFFSANESQLSLYKFIESTGFDRAFSDTIHDSIGIIKPVTKKGLIGRITPFLDNVNNHMKHAIRDYKDNLERHGITTVDVGELLNQTYHSAIFKALFAFDLTPHLCAIFDKFSNSVTVCGSASNIFPTWVLNRIFLRDARARRNEYINQIMPQVMEYVDDESMDKSPLIRCGADMTFESLGGRKLSPEEICQLILSIHFAITSTPIPLCSQVIKEFSRRKELWKRMREELNTGMGVTEITGNKILHAALIEGARLNSNTLILFRKTFSHSTLGPYYVGDADIVAVPGSLLFDQKQGEEIWTQASEYRPERFLKEEENEPMDPKSFWLWSAGAHSCTGRNISMNAMKIFLAHFINEFDMEIVSVGKKNYFTVSVILLQDVKVRIAIVN